MKAVVTGGAGFIGSNLADRLVADGHEVHILDDLSLGHRRNIPAETTFHQGSVLDRELLAEACAGADAVFHQAALPSVPRSVQDPVTSHQANVTGTLFVLEAARHNDSRVVFAASSSAYGNTDVLPKVETMVPAPLSPYAVNKLAGEHYCRAYHEVYGLKAAALRYFNVYGPRQDPSGAYAAVIPRFIAAAKAGAPLTIDGDGEQTRDFTFVADAVAANIAAAASPRAAGQVMNIGAGGRTSINQLAQAILDATGSQSELVHGPPRPGDVRDSLADIELARDRIGYDPQVPIAEGIQATVDWFA